MGIIKKGILGGFSGKIGQVVGGNWKGIDYMRSLPASVANPRTTGQVNQRNAFKGCTQFFSLFLGSIVQVFWNGKKPQMSGYNDIVQNNVVNFGNTGLPVYADLKFSTGPLLNETLVNVVADVSANEVSIEWADNSGTGNAVDTDYVNIVVINETNNTKAITTLVARRDDISTNIELLGMTVGDTINVYVFTSRNGNNKFTSDTLFTTLLATA